VVKEADGKNDFVAVKKITCGYRLAALLQRRFEVDRVRLIAPHVNLSRGSDGRFNFESLKPLQAPSGTRSSRRTQPLPTMRPAGVALAASDVSSGGLPLSLVVKRWGLEKARISFVDKLGKLPGIELKADADGHFSLPEGAPFSQADFSGKLAFDTVAQYQKLAPTARGEVSFDPRRLDFKGRLQLDKQRLEFDGNLADYRSKIPQLVCNLSSPELDLAYLAGLGENLKSDGKPAAVADTSRRSQPSTATAPLQFTANGRIEIGRALYQQWQLNDFKLVYDYRQGTLKLDPVSAELAEGHLQARSEFKSFPEKLDFSGDFGFEKMQLERLLAMAAPKLVRRPSGLLKSNFKFSGHGRTSPALRQSLNLVGDYEISDLRLENTQATRELVAKLGLDELADLKLEKLAGNLRVLDGAVNLDSHWQGDALRGSAQGKIGLDGRLDLPLKLVLSPDLSQRLVQRYAWAQAALNDAGEASLDFHLAGTLDRPDLQLDRSKFGKRVEKKVRHEVEKHLFDYLDRRMNKGQNSKNLPDAGNNGKASPAVGGHRSGSGFE
jgi:uncharacterized protein involved in outer membrane biogenesis